MSQSDHDDVSACVLRLSVHRAYPWNSVRDGEWQASARGYAFYCGARLDARQLAREAASQAALGSLVSFISQLNGSFCVAVTSVDEALAAVDRLRSLPLYYRSTQSELTVADDSQATLPPGELPRLQQGSIAEILRCGYTLGDATLIEGVCQLQAGQYLSWSRTGGLRRAFYYQHLRGGVPSPSPQGQWETLQILSLDFFQLFVEQLNGRTCVVPLSGGYDSRYILSMLHRLRYPHVICYTHGARRSLEIGAAKKTAGRLGYPWHFIEYDKGVWARFVSSPDAKRYLNEASGCASLPHVQDYPSVLWLSEHELLPPDSVFSPGFCGDLLGGSYVPKEVELEQGQSLTSRGLGPYIHATHMVLSNRLRRGPETQLLAAIEATLSDYPMATTIEDFVSVNEAWFTCHKVARFVINSLRVYEHFGYEWLMPLWDNELAETWYRVPLDYLLGGRLYNEFLFEWLFRPLGVAFEKPQALKAHWPITWVEAALPEWLFGAIRTTYVHGKMRTRPPNPDADSDLARLLRAAAADEGIVTSRSRDVNKVLAPVFLSRLCRQLGATREFEAVYDGR